MATKAQEGPILAVGNKVIIRTITLYYTGEVEALDNGFVTLRSAAWIADTGRWAEALKTGRLNEVEPFPDRVAVSLASVVDVTLWSHALPRETR